MRRFMAKRAKSKEPFISTWDTTKPGVSNSNQIALPLVSNGVYNFKVYDSDGDFIKHITDYLDNVVTLPSAGVQQITIIGQLERFTIFDSGDKNKLLSIQQFGSDFELVDGFRAFNGAGNLTEIGDDLDVSQVDNLSDMFYRAYMFNSDISNWKVNQVTDMTGLFRFAYVFNSDIGSWEVGQVKDMSYMFNRAYLFNYDISSWDVSKVTNMLNMFFDATAFNQDISAWDFSAVTNLRNFMRNKSAADYNAQYYTNLLKRWSENAQDNLVTDMGTIEYTAEGQQYRDILTNTKGWTIIDGGQEA